MTHPDSQAELPSGVFSSKPIALLQWLGTRLRFILAVPIAIGLLALVDRDPIWPGAVLALLGEAHQLWATAHLRKNVRLIMSGPYAWHRNPMYAGRFVVGLGLLLLTWRWYFIAGYIVLYGIYAQARVLGEERRLRGIFGQDYADYCAKVRRWLPRPPKETLSRERWSWDAVFRNHELRVAGGVVLMLALARYLLHHPVWILGPG